MLRALCATVPRVRLFAFTHSIPTVHVCTTNRGQRVASRNVCVWLCRYRCKESDRGHSLDLKCDLPDLDGVPLGFVR